MVITRSVYMAHGKTYLIEKHHQNSKSLKAIGFHVPSERAVIWLQIGLTPEKKISSYQTLAVSFSFPNIAASSDAATIMMYQTQKTIRPTHD